MSTTTVAPKKPQMREERSEPYGVQPMSPSGFPFFLSHLRNEFDQILHRFGRGWPNPWNGNGWHWDVDVRNEDHRVVVRAEAPGFEPTDFDIKVHDNELTLRAVRKTKKEEKERGYREEQEQEYYQAVALPAGIDADKVTAKYEKGILTVNLPKTPDAKGRKIPITGG